MVWTKMLWKTVLGSALVGGFLLLGGATAARADDYDSCRRNVDKWEDRLERDIDRHGAFSRQANHDRHELGEARESCEHRYGDRWRDHDDYNRYGDRR
jgi:outer membrane murein-binding lipoprotein Lpp